MPGRTAVKELKVIIRGEEKTVAGSVSLEVIGIKELAKALVRFLSNLTAKGAERSKTACF